MSATAVLHPDGQRFPAGTTVKAYKRSNWHGLPGQPSGTPEGSQDASATVATDGSVTFTGLTAQTDYLLYAAAPDRYSSFSTKVATEGAEVYTGVQDFSGATVTLPSGLIVPADSVGTAAIQALAVTTAKIANNAVTAAKVAADVATQAELDAEASTRAAADVLHAPLASPTFTGVVTEPAASITGLTGATAGGRVVGFTADGPPATGTFAVNDVVFTAAGAGWICTVAGTPGTWVSAFKAREQLLREAVGVFAENVPLWALTTTATPVSQLVYYEAVELRAGDVVTNIVPDVHVLGTGTAPTNAFVALYSSALARLAVSADLASSAIWTTVVGRVSAPLSAPYTVTASGLYYVALLFNGVFGTTQLTLARCATPDSTSAVYAGKPRPSGTQAAQTTMPANATLAQQASPKFYLGVS